MSEEAIKEAEDTMSILSYSTGDCTVSSKQKFIKIYIRADLKFLYGLGMAL